MHFMQSFVALHSLSRLLVKMAKESPTFVEYMLLNMFGYMYLSAIHVLLTTLFADSIHNG